MRILVTGGAGYIGSTTAAHLLAAGHDVTVYDNLSRGHAAAVPNGAQFVQGDIGDREALDALLADAGFDAIIHFAALIEAGESMEEPARFFQFNVCKSVTLIDAATQHGVPNFLFSSTAGVYAGKDTHLLETDPVQPANVYGETKHMVERVLGWYHQLRGLRVCLLRYFNAAGAALDAEGKVIRGEDHRPETHLIPLVLQVALAKREQIAIFGDDYPTPDGTNIRDYIHIDDLAQAHVLAVEALGAEQFDFAVYNLGNGQGYSNREVVETARRVTGHPIPAVSAARRPGDAPVLIASSEKIQRELGWRPRYPELQDIIRSAWEWHRQHPDGYNRK